MIVLKFTKREEEVVVGFLKILKNKCKATAIGVLFKVVEYATIEELIKETGKDAGEMEKIIPYLIRKNVFAMNKENTGYVITREYLEYISSRRNSGLYKKVF